MAGIQDGQQVEVTVEGISAEGQGIGRTQGRVCFVSGTLPGERVRARITHAGGGRLFAECAEVLSPSPDRVAPACPVYGRCGGCQLMHARYPAQLALKQRIVSDTLRSVAGVVLPDLAAILGAESELGYRNRGQYPVAFQQGRTVTGFFAARSHEVIAVDSCALHDPRVDEAVRGVRAWARHKKVSIYDETRHEGWLRHIVVRVAPGTGEILVVLVGASEQSEGVPDLVRRLRRGSSQVVGIGLNLNPERTNVILGKRTLALWGRAHAEDSFFDLRFRLSPGSFFQVNTAQARVLFEQVRGFVRESDGPVLDAYCGVGVLALILAKDGRETVGIEMDGEAVRDAYATAQANGLSRVSFSEGRVEKVLPRMVAQGFRPGCIVLDPPRKGCATEVLSAVAESGASRLAYVSCHPGTLARDLVQLFAQGFRLETLRAVDMFPQTCHVELFAGLVRG